LPLRNTDQSAKSMMTIVQLGNEVQKHQRERSTSKKLHAQEGIPRGIRLQPALVWQHIDTQALCLKSRTRKDEHSTILAAKGKQTLRPLRKRMSVMQMPIQLSMPDTALMLENQVKTFEDPAETPIYESRPSYEWDGSTMMSGVQEARE